MKRVDIAIEQVIFENSPVGLGSQLRRVRGVSDVEVDREAHRARITFDDRRLTAEDVRRFVDGCGYGYGPCTAPVDIASPTES